MGYIGLRQDGLCPTWDISFFTLRFYYYYYIIIQNLHSAPIHVNTCSKALWQPLPWFYKPVHYSVISTPRGAYSSILQPNRRSELVRSTCIRYLIRLPTCQVGRMWIHHCNGDFLSTPMVVIYRPCGKIPVGLTETRFPFNVPTPETDTFPCFLNISIPFTVSGITNSRMTYICLIFPITSVDTHFMWALRGGWCRTKLILVILVGEGLHMTVIYPQFSSIERHVTIVIRHTHDCAAIKKQQL